MSALSGKAAKPAGEERDGADEASLPTPEAARRLKCSACGVKRVVLFRARDEPEAKRWFVER